MTRQFNPPSINQLRWLSDRDLDSEYTAGVLMIYEMLRGHSANHGLPYGMWQGVSRTEYEEALCSLLGELHIVESIKGVMTPDDTKHIIDDLLTAIRENVSNARALFEEVRRGKSGPEPVDEFLDGVLDCYSSISKRAPVRGRRSP